MASPRKKERAKTPARRKRTAKKSASEIVTHPRRGLPAADSVQAVVEFVSPQKVRYTILKTSEMDAYDRPSIAPRKPKKNRKPR